jgi:4-amino-4-deoxy-L-arabinose transferase-like glycosyltransferase
VPNPPPSTPPQGDLPPPSQLRSRERQGPVLGALLLVLIVFAFLLLPHRARDLREIDSQAYFLMAESLARFEWPRWTEDVRQFHGHVWVHCGHGQVAVKYGPGWPLLLAAGYRLGGLNGALWVNPVFALVAAVVFCLLATELFNLTAAYICAAVWLLSPMLASYCGYPLTHSTDIAFVVVAFYLFALWGRKGGWILAAAAGLCAGYLPLIRPADVLLWPSMALMVWARRRETGARTPVTRESLVLVAAAAIPLAFLALFNTVNFGSMLQTGYSLTGEQSAFDFHQLPARLGTMIQSRRVLLEDGYWCLILTGIVAGLVARPSRWRITATLLLWVIPLAALHLGYYFFSGTSPFWRFLLATSPGMVLLIGPLVPVGDGRDRILRRLLFAAFTAWLFVAPPGLLSWLNKIQRGDPTSKQERQGDPLAAAASFLLSGRDHGCLEMGREIVRQGPATVFGSDTIGWTLGATPGIRNYDLGAWIDPHFDDPPGPLCARTDVWEDAERHQALHAWRADLGREGLRTDFFDQVRRQLDQGRRVYLAPGRSFKILKWLRPPCPVTITPVQEGLWELRAEQRPVPRPG